MFLYRTREKVSSIFFLRQFREMVMSGVHVRPALSRSPFMRSAGLNRRLGWRIRSDVGSHADRPHALRRLLSASTTSRRTHQYNERHLADFATDRYRETTKQPE
jgi:hypothetical protein